MCQVHYHWWSDYGSEISLSSMAEEKHLCWPACLQFVLKNPSFDYVTENGISLVSTSLYLSSCHETCSVLLNSHSGVFFECFVILRIGQMTCLKLGSSL